MHLHASRPRPDDFLAFFRGEGQIVVTRTSWSKKRKFRVLLLEKTHETEGNLEIFLVSLSNC